MQVRLAFSVMIQVDADILLIDEVLAVGDAAFQQKCFDVFNRLRDEGKTILFVTHDMARGAALLRPRDAARARRGRRRSASPSEVGGPLHRAELRPRAGDDGRAAARTSRSGDGTRARSSRPGSRTSTASAHDDAAPGPAVHVPRARAVRATTSTTRPSRSLFENEHHQPLFATSTRVDRGASTGQLRGGRRGRLLGHVRERRSRPGASTRRRGSSPRRGTDVMDRRPRMASVVVTGSARRPAASSTCRTTCALERRRPRAQGQWGSA